ncbi:hypothetical protein M9434_005852 [Picochlorum sp. BPE23]|nr:hypothetical protein M9434_005852 [Picochlorum sp. BPE23]
MSDIVSLSDQDGSPIGIAKAVLGDMPFSYEAIHNRTGLSRSACAHAVLSACTNIPDGYDYGKAGEKLLERLFGEVTPSDVEGRSIEGPSAYIQRFRKYAESQGVKGFPRITCYVVEDGIEYALGILFYVYMLFQDKDFMLSYKKTEFESDGRTISYTDAELGDFVQEECAAYKAGYRSNREMEMLEEDMGLQGESLIKFRAMYERRE